MWFRCEIFLYSVTAVVILFKAQGYAYAKIETLAYVRIFQKIEYAYDTFHTLNSIQPDLPETYVYPFTPVSMQSQSNAAV